jgi:hypothetical protein
MLELLILVLLLLWLFGYFGRGYWRVPRSAPSGAAPAIVSGNWVHILLVIVVVLVVLRLLGVD